MGLTNHATGHGAVDAGLHIERHTATDRVLALAGNPNVGKSTLFNALTGLKQHTGNWPGKTVSNAQGDCFTPRHRYVLVDIPGTYSLLAHSAEEEVARNFICFGEPDGVVVVCDATCLQRNLHFVLQTIEVGLPVVVCVNLMDEAARKHIHIDLAALQRRLGVPVVATVARQKHTLQELLRVLDDNADKPAPISAPIPYPSAVEAAVGRLSPLLKEKIGGQLNGRWLALRLLEGDPSLMEEITRYIGEDLLADETLAAALAIERQALAVAGLKEEALRDALVTAINHRAAALCRGVVTHDDCQKDADRAIDRVVTGRLWGYPLMLLLLALIFWLTIVGANGPSQWLTALFARGQAWLSDLFDHLHAPPWLHGAVIDGCYRVLAWVVAVMLPPMAIFFPLFTLLEDIGYLPRVAYNLDRPFHRCNACGKQALTMCMGFGCNAAGVVGCRIIDSPRERLLAVLTNSLVPCNGRFPTLITLLTLFFVGRTEGGSLWAALLLTGVILLSVLATLGVTRLLSATLLKGAPSSFTLELPPYRLPQWGQVLVRSVLDRTLFVLGRAAAVAAPAGLLIWLLANITAGDRSLLSHTAAFLDPVGRALGMDGAILLAFILGFPANEIVLPLTVMTYLAQGTLTELPALSDLRLILLDNGWTWHTAVATMLFSLFHWPCSTTLLTVRKETGSLKWTALAAAIPTTLGAAACLLLRIVAAIWG
ncbi:MAG: ferrous iron transport protein B [Clostridia bacterium]|nr:ferrous iron transport protein B [Clostridia bacterium]